MRVSMKVDYGVRALVDLAQHYGQGPAQSKDIAARQGIPEPFLDQLLTSLRKAGFINSRRGPQGGHALARLPSQVSLGEIISSLEGSVAPIDCVEGLTQCVRSGSCAQREVWQSIAESIHNMLNSISIDDLAQRQLRREEQAMYYI